MQSLIPSNSAIDARIQSNIAGQMKKSSLVQYQSEMRRIGAWLESMNKRLEDVTYDDVVAWRDSLANADITAKTRQRKFSMLRRVFNEAVNSGIIAHDPSARVRGFKTQESNKHKALTEKQLIALLAAIDRSSIIGARDYAMLRLLAFNGLRRAEIVALMKSDYTERDGFSVLTIIGKGDKPRLAKLQKPMCDAIDVYLRMRYDNKNALFLASRQRDYERTEHLSTKSVERILARRARAIDVILTPHDLRATFATLTLRAGARVELVQDAMGHTDIRTTMIYRKKMEELEDNATDYLQSIDA